MTVGIVSRSELASIGAQSEHASDPDASEVKGVFVYTVSEDHVDYMSDWTGHTSA